jgi:hypothetical protein
MLPILFGSTYALTRLLFGEGATLSTLSEHLDEKATRAIFQQGISPLAVKKDYVGKQSGGLPWNQVGIVVDLDDTFSIHEVSAHLQRALLAPAVLVDERDLSSRSEARIEISAYYRQLLLCQVLLRQTIAPLDEAPDAQTEESQKDAEDAAPKIALIIDDVGYDMERALELIHLGRPMTLSIFPQLTQSRKIAEIAHDMGYEIMMHLPMEPGESLKRNPGFIMQNMNREEMHWILDRDLESISHVSGVNNHQGSKMTRDEKAMALVMEFLAEKDLYFVDSRTVSDSIAYDIAKEYGLRASENDVFLDNEKNLEYIKGRLEILMMEAEEKGRAIGICHVHPATIQALREMFPVIEKRGFELVYASEVVE